MDAPQRPGSPRLLTIGAVARATGLSADTLRVWNRRYGFPAPHRKPSGHRLYSAADVRRLRRIAAALAQGHRPGKVVSLSDAGLDALLADAAELRVEPSGSAVVRGLLDRVRRYDAAGLSSALLADAATLGPLEFLQRRAIPMIQGVGDAWERGELGVHHEHLFSERLEDVLRAVRLPLERSAGRARMVLATLSGETHGLGVQMAALVAAVAGLSPHVLGTDTPVADVAAAARARKASAVGVSVSVSTGGASSRGMLRELRGAVAASVPIVVGGAGARRSHPPGGCILMEELASLHDWARRFAAHGGA